MRVLAALFVVCALACTAEAYFRVASWDVAPSASPDFTALMSAPASSLEVGGFTSRIADVAREISDVQPDLVVLFDVPLMTEIFEGIEVPVELLVLDGTAEALKALSERSVSYTLVHSLELNDLQAEATSTLHPDEDAEARVRFYNVVLVKTSEVGLVGASSGSTFADLTTVDFAGTDVTLQRGYQRVEFTREGKTWLLTAARVDDGSIGENLSELLSITEGDAHSLVVGNLGVAGPLTLSNQETEELHPHYAWFPEAGYADLAFFRRSHEQETCCFDLLSSLSTLTSRTDYAFVRTTDGKVIDCDYQLLGVSERAAAHAGVYTSIGAPHRGPRPHVAQPVELPQPILIQTYPTQPSSSLLGDDDESDENSNPLVTPTTPGDDGDPTFIATGPLSPTTPEDDDSAETPTTPLRTSSGNFQPFTGSTASMAALPTVFAVGIAAVLAMLLL